MYRIHLWCVLLQNAHSATRSGVGFFCLVEKTMLADVRPSYARRHGSRRYAVHWMLKRSLGGLSAPHVVLKPLARHR